MVKKEVKTADMKGKEEEVDENGRSARRSSRLGCEKGRAWKVNDLSGGY